MLESRHAAVTTPRLLYVGDIPVEDTQHSAIQMYRLFARFSPDRLRIVETGKPSDARRRLPGVTYTAMPLARRPWLHTRVHGIYAVWLSLTVPTLTGQVQSALADFQPDAIVTIGHGFGWLLAAEMAQRLGVPLHLIVHDDWPKLSGRDQIYRGFLRRRFADVYRQAHSRLCISPFMVEEYERRYGVVGSVLYPFRDESCPVFDAQPARVFDRDEMVVAYCGGCGREVMSGLKDLASVLADVKARLVVFGLFDEFKQRQLLANSQSIEFRGFVPYPAMLAGLRAADVLFAPMTFSESYRDNMTVSFPSKLADYTAMGVPLLVQGPPYCSAVRWANANAPVAEVVDTPGAAGLATALRRLKDDANRRRQLAERALAVGAAFRPASAHERFDAAINSVR